MHIASISHGKDSIAMLHVIKDILHWPLDGIITADVWFDDDTRAELPPMVEWKDKADKIIFERWGVPVTHICAMRGGTEKRTLACSIGKRTGVSSSAAGMDFRCNESHGATPDLKLTYKSIFYRTYQKGKRGGNSTDSPSASDGATGAQDSKIYGFPTIKGNWCTGELKLKVLNFPKRQKAGWCTTWA